jgi:hypothetical protein
MPGHVQVNRFARPRSKAYRQLRSTRTKVAAGPLRAGHS